MGHITDHHGRASLTKVRQRDGPAFWKSPGGGP